MTWDSPAEILEDFNQTLARLWLDSGPNPTRLLMSRAAWRRLRLRPRVRTLIREYPFRRLAVRRLCCVRRSRWCLS